MSSLPTSPESCIWHSSSNESESTDSGFLNSLNHSPEESKHSQTDKLFEFNKEKAEVNLAFEKFITSELVLNTYKALINADSQIAHISVKFVKDTILTDKLQKRIKMKNRNEDSFDLLGLNDCFTESKCKLPAMERTNLKLEVWTELTKKIEELKDKKTFMEEVFFKHKYQQEDILHDKKIEIYLEPFISLSEQFDVQALQLKKNAELMYNLLNYQQYCHCENQIITNWSMVISKVKFINYSTSILKEKVELLRRKNKNYINDLNSRGKELEKSVDSLKEKAYYLKETLDKYKRKEKHSVVFRELVNDYNKTHKEFQGKTLTLSILNDPDSTNLSLT